MGIPEYVPCHRSYRTYIAFIHRYFRDKKKKIILKALSLNIRAVAELSRINLLSGDRVEETVKQSVSEL